MINNPLLQIGATGYIYERETRQPLKGHKQIIAITGCKFTVKEIAKNSFLVDTKLGVGEICFDVPTGDTKVNELWRDIASGFEKIATLTNEDGSVSEQVTLFIFEKKKE